MGERNNPQTATHCLNEVQNSFKMSPCGVSCLTETLQYAAFSVSFILERTVSVLQDTM